MAIDVRPEVARSHTELNSLCEKFEASIDELCASSVQELDSHLFYESECVEIAAVCADVLRRFPNVSFYEDKAYENAVADAEKTFRQQKSELAETQAQKVKAYDLKITDAENALSQQIQRLKDTAVQSMKTVQSKVEELSEIATTVGFKFSSFTDIDPTKYMERNTTENDSKVPFRRALADAKKSTVVQGLYWLFFFAGIAITSGVLVLFLGISIHEGLFFLGSIPSAIFAMAFYSRKKKEVAKTLKTLLIAAEQECAIIRREMQKVVEQASAAHDEKVNELLSSRERDDQSTGAAAERFSATRAKKIEDAKAKKDQALAYIQQEFRALDMRLCRCLDKFQALVDTWTTEHVHVTSILNDNRIKNLNEDRERNGSTMTRIGTIGMWDFTERQYQVDQNNAEHTLSDINNSTVKHTDDAEDVTYNLDDITNFDEQGPADSIENLKQMAQQGDAEAQNSLGDMYVFGKGVQQDYGKALNWYQKASEQGYAIAQDSLATMYRRGFGVQKDSDKSMYWTRKAAESYQKAAEQGDAYAQGRLGGMYEHGAGVPQDFVAAVNWYQKAAEQNDAEAQYALGLMYEFGLGVKQDSVEATKWYRQAARKGHDGAKQSLQKIKNGG